MEEKKNAGCDMFILGWVESCHTLVTKVSEFRRARIFSYSKLVTDLFDFNAFVLDRLQQRVKKQAEAASVNYNFVCLIFLHKVFLDYRLYRDVCQTELYENKKGRLG